MKTETVCQRKSFYFPQIFLSELPAFKLPNGAQVQWCKHFYKTADTIIVQSDEVDQRIRFAEIDEIIATLVESDLVPNEDPEMHEVIKRVNMQQSLRNDHVALYF